MDRTDNFSPGYCEYLVDGFAGKIMNIVRISGTALLLAVTAAVCSLLTVMPQVVFIWLVVVVFFEIMLIRFTKREFEYTVAMGEFSVDVIYGKRYRRRTVNLKLSDAERVFPINGFDDLQIKRTGADKIYFFSPKKSEHMYCLVTKDDADNRTKTAIVFSSCKRLNDAIKFYNRACLTERK